MLRRASIAVLVFLFAGAASAAAGDLPLLPAPVTVSSGIVRDIELADLDGDGLADLLSAENPTDTSSELIVRAGLGSGRFGPPQTLVVTPHSDFYAGQQIATVDLDADADLDVIYTGAVGSTLYVLRNDGGFQFTQSTMILGNGLYAAATGDVNKDGKQDVVVASAMTNSVILLFGDGLGGLHVAGAPSTGVMPGSLVLIDLDLDGWLDIATANSYDGTIGVLRGTGGGSFAPVQSYAVCGGLSCVAASDLNGDGYPELMTGCITGGLAVLTNAGGSFTGPSFVPAAASNMVSDILPVDLDGDSRTDVVLGSFNSATHVLFGTGNGGFHATPQSSYVMPVWIHVALGQLGGDELPDVVVSDEQDFVTFTDVGVSLDAPPRIPVPSGVMALADVTGDGLLDVIGLDEPNKAINVRIGNGTDTLDASPSALVSTVVTASLQTLKGPVRAGDLDGDGDADPVTFFGQNVLPTLAQPDGTLVPAPWFALGPVAIGLQVFDLDGDGFADLVTGNSPSRLLRVFRGLGNGSFTLTHSVTSPVSPANFAAGDVNADGELDLAVTSGGVGVALLLGNGDGTFAAPTTPLGAQPATDAALIDLDADGDADLVTPSSNGLRVSLSNGTGGFDSPTVLANGNGSVAVGDVDGDGLQDVVTSWSGLVGVFHANGDGTLATAQLFAGAGAAVGDLNGDGDADVLGASAPWLTVSTSRTAPTVTALGGALAGAGGPPELEAVGSLAPLSPLALHLTHAASLAPSALVVGFAELNLPFKGGVLVPSPDLVVDLSTKASGSLLLNLLWPAGFPSGSSLWMQAWIVDAGGPKGLAATNALRFDVP